ncbi:MAG: cytochrome P450 [Paracoccaceae bacterium]|nr:cytochrome P450 [Paracoccaceae bacterium]
MIDDGHLDIADHDSFTGGVPYRTFARLRRTDPVHWTETRGARGFWSVTRHADILTANRNFRVFSSAQGIRIEDQTREEYLARRTFQETDPPEHRAIRMMVNPAFSRQTVAGYEAMIRDLADRIVDEAVERREFDIVDAIARRLPMLMLGRILGVPEADLEWLVEKGDALIGNTDPDFTDAVLDRIDSNAYRFMPFRSPAGAELYDYADTIISGDRPVDPDGILALVLGANRAEPVMEGRDFKNFFCLLVAAGNDTTRYSIAMALHLITWYPELLSQLRAGKVWPTAPDEFIRLASPTMHFRRTATADTELGGRSIREGDKVVLWFVSGNRDETVFNDPDQPRLDRNPNPHLAFGQGGVHFCLGMWLARLEVRVLLQSLAARITGIEALDEPIWTRSNFICGVKRQHVRVTV